MNKICLSAVLTTLVVTVWAAPMPYSVNVRDFGAVGDGVHDDTLALQKAADAVRVDSCERGQLETLVKLRLTCTQDGPVPELYFPKGVYRTTGPVVFTGNAFLRGEEAEVRNESPDSDTFFFDLGFRLDIEGLRFTGGRHQVRQFTQNRDIASARIVGCTFERSHGTAVLLDCFSDVNVKRSAGKAAFFKSAYERKRTPEGRIALVDVDPASRKPSANSTLALVERCTFRDCARAVFAHTDGVNIDRCVFFDTGVACGPIVEVRTTTQLSRLKFDCRGSVPGRVAIAFGRGSNSARDVDIHAPDGMDPFRFDIPPTYSIAYDNYGSSLVLQDVTLDTGTNPVLTIGAEYLPEMMAIRNVRQTRPTGAKPQLFAFRRVPTESDLALWASKHRQSGQGVKGVFGWSATGVGDYDIDLPPHLAQLRCAAGLGVERHYLADMRPASGEIFTDESIGVADLRQAQDDTDRVEALFRRAAAAGGGTVLLPPRWITLSRTLDVPKRVRVTAAGRAVLRAADYRLVFFRILADDPDVVFSNVLFNRGQTALATVASKGSVRFENCHFYDQDGVTLKTQAPGRSELQLEVRYGTAFVPHLYDGNAAPATFDSFWLEYAPDFDKSAWDVVSEKSQVCLVNRPGGVLRCYNVLGVPCVYWHAAKMKGGQKAEFFSWVAHPEAHPELYGDFRWVDNFGDYQAIDFRYGGEWAGLTPVYQYGAEAKSLLAGHIVGGSLYGWTKAKHATVLSDREEANVVLTELFCMNRMKEPTTVLWRDSSGNLARAKGWTKTDCYPHASVPYVAIEIPEQPSPTEKFAAEELGAWLDRRKANLGDCRFSLRQDDAAGADAFRLKIKSNRVEITGGVRGVLYGTYEFLQRFCGIEWFARDTTTCPEGGKIALPALYDQTERPAFDMRELYFYGPHADGDFAARLRLNGDFSGVMAKHGGKMCPVGAGLRSHTFHRLVPHEDYGTTHPEYFALRGGRRLSKPEKCADYELQLCLSNPEVRAVLERNLLNAIDTDPAGCRFGVFQNDNKNYCQCEDCARIAEEEGSLSGPIVRFVNAVAGTVRRLRPDLLVQTGAYQYSRHPSRTAYADNVLLELCTIERDLTEPIATGTDGEIAAIRKDFDGWSKLAKNLYVFDYVTDFNAYQMPLPNIDVLQADVRYYRDRGFRWVTAEGPYHGTGGDFQELKAYLLAKLMWNPEADVDRLTDDFLSAYYGKAAPVVKEYLSAERELGRLAGTRRMTCFAEPTDASVVTDAFLDRAVEIWARAIRAAKNDSERTRRHVRSGAFGVNLIRYYRLRDRFKPADFSLRRATQMDGADSAELVSLARRLQCYLKSEPTVRLCEGWERAELPRRRQLADIAAGVGMGGSTGGVDKVEIGVGGLLVAGRDAGYAAVVAADGALGEKAVRLVNTSFDWCVQKELPVSAFDEGVAYRLRIRVKVTKKANANPSGAAFYAGVTDRKNRASVFRKTFAVADVRDGWQWYDLGTFLPGEQRFFWFGSGTFDKTKVSESPNVSEVLFDRLEIAREEK